MRGVDPDESDSMTAREEYAQGVSLRHAIRHRRFSQEKARKTLHYLSMPANPRQEQARALEWVRGRA